MIIIESKTEPNFFLAFAREDERDRCMAKLPTVGGSNSCRHRPAHTGVVWLPLSIPKHATP